MAVENHLNLLEPSGIDAVPAAVLAAYLNSGAADAAFRCLSGTTAVSAFELRALALPAPDRLGPLAALVQQGASRAEIEAECTRLVLGRRPAAGCGRSGAADRVRPSAELPVPDAAACVRHAASGSRPSLFLSSMARD